MCWPRAQRLASDTFRPCKAHSVLGHGPVPVMSVVQRPRLASKVVACSQLVDLRPDCSDKLSLVVDLEMAIRLRAGALHGEPVTVMLNLPSRDTQSSISRLSLLVGMRRVSIKENPASQVERTHSKVAPCRLN